MVTTRPSEPHDGSWIADVLATAIAAQYERVGPGLALIIAEASVNCIWLAAEAIRQTKPAVLEPCQGRRVPLTDVGAGVERNSQVRPLSCEA